MEKQKQHIPEGWVKVSKLGTLCKVFNGLNGKTKEDFGEGKPFIPYINVFKNSKIDITELDYVNIKENETQNTLNFGDIIFTTSSETIKEVGMTSIFLNKSGIYYLNSFCFILRLNSLDWLLPQFSQYLFRSEKLRISISLLGQGSTRFNLPKKRLLKELTFLIPKSTAEQSQIAAILSQADEAIVQTEALIAKYERIKTGLMQDLLTKGIDENGNIRNEATHEFKDSPLGRIPVKWEVEKLSFIAEVINGGTPSTHIKDYWTNGKIPWLSVEDFNNGSRYVFKTSKKITHKGLLNSSTNILKPSEIIISARGTVGVISQMKYCMAFNQSCYGIKSKHNNKLPNDFLYYQLVRIFKEGLVSTGGSVFSTITKKTFDKIFIPFPNTNYEVNIITKRLGNLDLWIERQKQQLSKLKSLKTGLMQDLLSGKVRVNTLLKETEKIAVQ